MREVDQTTLIVPDVLAVDDDVVSIRDGDALAYVDVVVDEQGLRRSLDLHDEALMRSGRTRVIREQPRDGTVRGDLDAREMIRKGALDCRIRGGNRAARRREDRVEGECANGYERGTLSPGRCMRFSTHATEPQGRAGQRPMALRMRPAAISSASAITTTMAMRRKSFVT